MGQFATGFLMGCILTYIGWQTVISQILLLINEIKTAL